MSKTATVQRKSSTNGTGNGSIKKFSPDEEGLQQALEVLKPIVLAYDAMKIETDAEIGRERTIIKKYAVREDCNFAATVHKTVNLHNLMEEAIEAALENAVADFNETVEEIRRMSPEALVEIEDDLSSFQKDFRETTKRKEATLLEKAEAYVVVNDFLFSVLEKLEAEERLREAERRRASIASAVSVL